MIVKKSGNSILGAQLNAKEQKALDIEISRQIAERDREYTDDYDALVLYALHVHLGFGKKRLRRFWEAFSQEHDKLIAYYQMPEDNVWLADRKLKEIGVDVAAWNRERLE